MRMLYIIEGLCTKVHVCMSRRKLKQTPYILFLILTMVAIAILVQFDRMQKKTSDIRAKAYEQTSTGLRIEAEEMTLSGGATKDTTGMFIQF